jgi:hypothetical protein
LKREHPNTGDGSAAVSVKVNSVTVSLDKPSLAAKTWAFTPRFDLDRGN